MRLWHKDLIKYLPTKQLRGQWRECFLVAKELKEGTLNHAIVNRVKDYPVEHFVRYCQIVASEMHRRGYGADWLSLWHIIGFEETMVGVIHTNAKDIFTDWHNDRYMFQCLYNLQEKYDCGSIPKEEWEAIRQFVMSHDDDWDASVSSTIYLYK